MVPATIDADGGVTAIDMSAGLLTLSEAVPLMALDVAVMVTGPPTVAPVATPALLMVAVAVAEELQVTLPVRFCVELSE